MKRGRIFFYLALILFFGLIAFVLIWQRFLSPSVQPQAEIVVPTPVIDVVNILVVSQNVPRGSVITRDVISMVPIQRELFIQGMFSNINEVEGRLAKFDLDSGIPLTQKMLADSAESLSGTGSLEALVIPRGMVVLAVPLDRLSNSYPLQAGDHVNVIVTLKFVDVDSDFQSLLPNNVPYLLGPDQTYADGWRPLTDKVETEGYFIPTVGKTEVILGIGQTVYAVPSEVQRPRIVSHNLLQNAVVLKVGNYSETLRASEVEVEEMQPEPPVSGEETPTPSVPDPDFLSLIVNPQDAVTLNYLLYSGAQLTLVLRSADDDSRVQTEAVTLQYLLNQYNIPVPVKLPYGLEPRVDQVTPLQFEYTPPPTPEQE